MRRVAVIPSVPGISRSISTTSGRRALAIWIASAPLAASPITSSSGSSLRNMRNPCRTTLWSSTMSTRTGIRPSVSWPITPRSKAGARSVARPMRRTGQLFESRWVAREGKIRLLLVDDQPAVLRGLRMWLGLEPDLVVVGVAEHGAEVGPLIDALRPHVVLMDVEMPGRDGLTVAAAMRYRCPAVPVVMLSLHDDIETRARAWAAGAA